MVSYSIGQYRYRGTGCATKVSGTTKGYVSTTNDVDATADDASFKDICINTPTLSTESDYYLKLKVPQDLNYTYTFNIRLTRQNVTAELKDSYQYLRTLVVAKPAVTGAISNVYTVVLYEDTAGGVRATIPKNYTEGMPTTLNELYLNKATGKYYIGTGGTSKIGPISHYNDIQMIANWKSEPGEYYGILEIVFRPVAAGFNQILLYMSRTAEDYNIQRNNADGSMEYGRIIDIEKFDYELYSLNNLVKNIDSSTNASLARIGVWAHPGLFMAVNGEEIRVGASGFYEMDVLPITSLGIFAPDNDYTNVFTIDYTKEDK